MGLFDFFKDKGKSNPGKKLGDEKPSDHEIAFAQAVRDIIGPTVERYEFVLHSKLIKEYSTAIVWRKNKLYIKVNIRPTQLTIPTTTTSY